MLPLGNLKGLLSNPKFIDEFGVKGVELVNRLLGVIDQAELRFGRRSVEVNEVGIRVRGFGREFYEVRPYRWGVVRYSGERFSANGLRPYGGTTLSKGSFLPEDALRIIEEDIKARTPGGR